jgi:hypothetical protein
MSSDETEPMTFGNPDFYGLLAELAERHAILAAAFGVHGAESQGFHEDPLASYRYASPDFGVDSWVYVLMRANECMRRLQAFVISDNPGPLDVRDQLLELSALSLISLVFFQEDVSKILSVFFGNEEADEDD